MDDINETIELLPFIHQVGGHSFMLSLDESTVCKALVPRELQFYQSLPAEVRKFTPAFHGVTKVRTTLKDDCIQFLSTPPPNYQPRGPAKAKVRFKKSGSIEIISQEGIFLEDSSSSIAEGLNPWVLICHKQHMMQLEENKCLDENLHEEQDFIVLENLVCRYACPCILDLKMGTRQYGDAASLAKKQSKMVKVVSTTSAKLGLRLGGMQVFQTNTRRYLCRNKFYGRTLSVSGFQQALVQFLHNGVRFRSDVLSALIKKLEELAAVLGRIDAIRLYTTSLLLLYEGEDISDVEDAEGIRPSLGKQDMPLGERRGSDSDLNRVSSTSDHSIFPYHDAQTLGKQSKRRTSSAANLDSQSGTSSNSSSSSTIFEENVSRTKTRTEAIRGRSFSTKSDPGGGPCPTEPRVDVRMVDFAHSTYKELNDIVVYSGPDRGFLFGLETLISMLKTVETEYG